VDYEQQVLEMIDDLARADAIPESVKLLNAQAVKAIAAGALRPGPVINAILRDKTASR
jgi:hypothetical protein